MEEERCCGVIAWTMTLYCGANYIPRRLGHMSPFFHAVLDITLEVDEREVTEDSGSVQVAIRKIGTNERSVFVRVFTVSGTAEGTCLLTKSICMYFANCMWINIYTPGVCLSTFTIPCSPGVLKSDSVFVARWC